MATSFQATQLGPVTACRTRQKDKPAIRIVHAAAYRYGICAEPTRRADRL
jgi:hypothetical protein